MFQPSNADHNMAIEELQEDLAKNRADVQEFEKDIALFEQRNGPDLPRAHRSELSKLKDQISLAESTIPKLESFNRSFGSVFASSGYRYLHRSQRIADWAIIKVNAARLNLTRPKNEVSLPLSHLFYIWHAQLTCALSSIF